MSFQFNSDKEQIRAVDPTIIGTNSILFRSGLGTNEKEVFRAQLDPTTGGGRVGINRTGRRVERIDVTSGGTGYTQPPEIILSAPNLDGGLQALASCTISPTGQVISILVEDPGDGYQGPPSVTIQGGNGAGASGQAFLDTVDYELDINGAIRTSTSIISDTARILNLDIDNFVTPDAQFRAPNLKTYANGTGTPWAPETIVPKNSYRWYNIYVYQALNVGKTGTTPPTHSDGIELNGEVQFKHIGIRDSLSEGFAFGESGESGVFPRSITPLLGDRSDAIATTEYVLNLATNDVGGRIYVSEQIGSNDNDGRSPVNPVRTIKKACQLAWQTPGVKETIVVAGGNYEEDNPISIPPDASVVGDNLRLVIIRPKNERKHIFKFGDKNYVIGVTYRDAIDSNGDSIFTWDYAMVFDDKQRVVVDVTSGGDFVPEFPVGQQVFGADRFRANFSENGGLTGLQVGQVIFGVNSLSVGTIYDVKFDITDLSNGFHHLEGTFDFTVQFGTFNVGETFKYGGPGTLLYDTNVTYEVDDLVWNAGDHVYRVTTAGTSGTSTPIHDEGAETATNGTAIFTWERSAYSLIADDIRSIRAEGEVVFEEIADVTNADEKQTITKIDFSQAGQNTTGGFGEPSAGIFGNDEINGGIIIYTNALEGRQGIHNFKEGEEIFISGLLEGGSEDLSWLNGYQRIYKVLEDADGRSRRFVIPKKVPLIGGVPQFTQSDYDPGVNARVQGASRNITFTLLNSPQRFDVSPPVSRRYQDACLQIRNNINFIADEVVGKVNDQFKKEYFATYDISGTPDSTFTPTNVTYDPSTGEAVFTVTGHGLSVGDGVKIAEDSLVFTCAMDGYATEHSSPQAHHYANGKSLPILATTANTFTLNVGASGQDQYFTPSAATYDPSTGNLVLTIGEHTLSEGEGIVIDQESLGFTCTMDNNQDVHYYPRLGHDKYASRSIPIVSVDQTSITLNVGASPSNKYFTPSAATYDASTGDLTVTVGQHGLAVGKTVVLENNSFTFSCDQDGFTTTHTYPRSGQDPYADNKSITITSVGSTQHTVTDANYDPATGVVYLTVPNHGFTQGDYVLIEDESLDFTCVLDGNTVTKSYPKPNYDYASKRWFQISDVLPNSFRIEIQPSEYTGAHTFVSATANGLLRQDGTFTINVGDGGTAAGSVHTFISASPNAIKFEPQSTHTFVSSQTNCVKHLPQSPHQFVRATTGALSVGGSEFKIYLGTSRFSHTYVSGGTVTFNGVDYAITNFIYDHLINGEATITTDTSIPGLANDSIVQLDGIVVSCLINNVLTQKTYPSFNIPVSDTKCKRDVGHFINAIIRDLEYGSNYNTINAARKYLSAGQIDYVDYEITQTVRAFEYARELMNYAMCKWRTGTGAPGQTEYTAQYSSLNKYIDPTIIDDDETPACDDVRSAINTLAYLFVDVVTNNASGTYLDAAYLISRNKDYIADEAYNITKTNYPNLGLNDIDERKCRRDIGYVLNGVLRDLVLGGNAGALTAGEFYFTGNSLTGIPESERGPTIYTFNNVRDLSILAMRNWKTNYGTGSLYNTRHTPIPQFVDNSILVDPFGTPSQQLTASTATYDPLTGDFVITVAGHSVTTSDSLRLDLESFTFTCSMDGYATEHSYPQTDQPAATQLLPVTSVDANTITVNVGASGADQTFTPTDATYDPLTGDLVLTITDDQNPHTLSVGEGIVLEPNSIGFTCTMDGNDSTKFYPRAGIDPFASRSIPIKNVTDTTITLNVGAAGANKYFTPSAANYNPSTGDLTVTVGQHGLGVGRSVVLEDNSFTFTCALDGNATQHTYPRPGEDPFAGKSIAITSVGSTSHTPTNVTYNPASGDVVVTIGGHGFSNGDYIKVDDGAFVFTCDLDGNTSQKSYPKAGYDWSSGRWLEIFNVSANAFSFNVGPSTYTGTHTFVSAAAGSVKRQDGTFTINVGTSSDTSVHTFVSASLNAIKYLPQSPHTFVSATTNAVKHLPQSTHLYVRSTANSISVYPTNGNAVCADVEQSLYTSFNLVTGTLDETIPVGSVTKTYGETYATGSIITYPDNTIYDQDGTVLTIRAVWDDNPIIEASPYTQNASVISFLGGSGAEIDGDKVKQPNCPFPGLRANPIPGEPPTAQFPNQGKSMVASAFTIVSFGGDGYKLVNDGYVQLVSVFCIFCANGILAESGGYASVTNSATNFGLAALKATGYRRDPYIFDSGYVLNGVFTPASISSSSQTLGGRSQFVIANLGRAPLEHYIIKIEGYEHITEGLEYYVDAVEILGDGPPYDARVTLEDGTGGGVSLFREIATGETRNPEYIAQLDPAPLVALHRPSIVNSSSHTWEFAGSGTNYLALPENGGTKTESQEQVQENYGRVYVSGTDELGDFKVGTFARIENRTGNITFTGTVSISEVEFLKLKGGDVVVTGFDASNTLGGANASNTKLPTQKAVRDFITNNLGPYINKPYSTNAVPRALVELTDSGKINIDQIPPLRPFNVFTVVTESERLSIEGALAGDIVIQENIPPAPSETFILNNDNYSLFVAFPPDPTLQFTIGDVFTGSGTGGKIQSTEYRTGVVYQITLNDGGFGYTSPPVITITGGNPQQGAVSAAAEATVANGEVVKIDIVLFNQYIGGKGYTEAPVVQISAPSGGGAEARQADASALIESRLYGQIVNNVKIEDTDSIQSSDIPSETVNLTRVINTSASSSSNWVSLSTTNISADNITSGTISTERLGTNASAANSFTFLRGDQSYALAVQSLKEPEQRYFAVVASDVGVDSNVIAFLLEPSLKPGHEITSITTGIQAETKISAVETDGNITTVVIDKLTTATIPTGTVIEFYRGDSPIFFDSTYTQGNFIEQIILKNGGSGFDNGTYFNVGITGGSGQGLSVNMTVADVGATSGVITDLTIVNGGTGYSQDFTITDYPSEIGNGSGAILLAKRSTINKQYANVTIDINRVEGTTSFGSTEYSTLGVARFLQADFTFGPNGAIGINQGKDSGLDADTLDGRDSAFFRDASNLEQGTVPRDRLSGSYNISVELSSGSTSLLNTDLGNVNGNPPAYLYKTGVTAFTRSNGSDGLTSTRAAGNYHGVLTFRQGGTGNDSTYGGVRQLAFTDNNKLFLRGSGSSVDTEETDWSNWYEVWTGGNDGPDTGMDSDYLDSKQGEFYQNALNIQSGRLHDRHLPTFQFAKDFRKSIRILDTGSVSTPNIRWAVYIQNDVTTSNIGAFSVSPWVQGGSLNVYRANETETGKLNINFIEINNDSQEPSNNYVIVYGTQTVGAGEAMFTEGIKIGSNFATAVAFNDWTLSDRDSDVDGFPDGTYQVAALYGDDGVGILSLGRDTVGTSPSIYFRSSAASASIANAAIVATGGNSTNYSGLLDVKVLDGNSFTVNSSTVWNASNIGFHSDGTLPTLDSQGNITLKSGVMLDENGDFGCHSITVDSANNGKLFGAASLNVLLSGDTMSGLLTISGLTAAEKALEVSGRADFLASVTVADDLRVDEDTVNNTATLFADSTNNVVAIGTNATEAAAKLLLVEKADKDAILRMYATTNARDARIQLLGQDGVDTTEGFELQYDNSVGDVYFKQIYTGITTTAAYHFNTANFANALTITGNGNVGINMVANDAFELDVAGDARVQTSIQLGRYDGNSGAPMIFAGATGAETAPGSGEYLSNFRIGNQLLGNDVFEITANDGSQGAVTWKSTPGIALRGTDNRVAINTIDFGGTDTTVTPNVQREYQLNIQGDININGFVFQNNAEFVTSRWTESDNELDIYRASKVWINPDVNAAGFTGNPDYALQVSGSLGVNGSTFTSGSNTSVYYANGDRQYIDTYGIFKTNRNAIDEDITIPGNTNAVSAGPLTINSGKIVTITSGSSWSVV